MYFPCTSLEGGQSNQQQQEEELQTYAFKIQIEIFSSQEIKDSHFDVCLYGKCWKFGQLTFASVSNKSLCKIIFMNFFLLHWQVHFQYERFCTKTSLKMETQGIHVNSEMSYYWPNTCTDLHVASFLKSQVTVQLSCGWPPFRKKYIYIADLVYFWHHINGWTVTSLILAKSQWPSNDHWCQMESNCKYLYN